MTDSDFGDIGRLDLRALDAGRDQARDDAVVAATLARLSRDAIDLVPLLALRRRITIAAAVLVAVAAGSMLVARTRPGDPGDEALVTWARTGHVPTNGELLAVYHGYQP